MPEPLFLLQMRFHTERLFRLGNTERLPPHEVDLGYLVHCQLAALFGPEHPKPFSLPEDPRNTRGRSFPVLCYSSRSKAALLEQAQTFSEPAAYEANDWEHFCEKQMPSVWRSGQTLGFALCTTPVVRLANTVEPPQRPWMKEDGPYKQGAEVDAFQVKKMSDPDTSATREEVYREWLKGQFERRGGARLLGADLVRFQRDRVVRRTQGQERVARVSERPVASFEGTLEIIEPSTFTELLRSGIGRHRAFGFGMLLLRPLSAR